MKDKEISHYDSNRDGDKWNFKDCLRCMINNYFFLTRFVRELQSDLTGSLFQTAFSQEKNKLILSFLANGREIFLEFHTGAQLPYLYIRDSFHRAKKNTSSFFEESSGTILRNIQIAQFERVTKFTFDQFFLFIFFRGKDSNAFVMGVNGKIKPFKSCDRNLLEEISRELIAIEFGNRFSFSNELPNDASIKDFKTKYPFFGKKIIPEILERSERNKKSINESIKEILVEIDTKDFGLFFDEQTKEYSILPESFLTCLRLKNEMNLTSCNEAVREYLREQFQYHHFQSLFKQTSKYFEKEISYSTSKLEALRKRLNDGSKENLYAEYANLLLINLQSVSKGLTQIEIEDIYHDGKAEIIPLKEIIILVKRNQKRFFSFAQKLRFYSYRKDWK